MPALDSEIWIPSLRLFSSVTGQIRRLHCTRTSNPRGSFYLYFTGLCWISDCPWFPISLTIVYYLKQKQTPRFELFNDTMIMTHSLAGISEMKTHGRNHDPKVWSQRDHEWRSLSLGQEYRISPGHAPILLSGKNDYQLHNRMKTSTWLLCRPYLLSCLQKRYWFRNGKHKDVDLFTCQMSYMQLIRQIGNKVHSLIKVDSLYLLNEKGAAQTLSKKAVCQITRYKDSKATRWPMLLTSKEEVKIPELLFWMKGTWFYHWCYSLTPITSLMLRS